MNRCLIVDTETTGLDPAKDQTVEIGAVLYSIPERAIVAQVSFLVPVNFDHWTNAEDVHGISDEMLADRANLLDPALRVAIILSLVEQADALVAHNLAFDLPFLEQSLGRDWERGLPRVCTLNDFEWPHASTSRSLVNIAVAHGVPVVKAHRALTDCQLIADLFDRVEDLELRIERALRPKAVFEALVSYEGREMAKSAGFRWNSDLGNGWRRRMAIEDVPELDFKVRQI